ncbi:uncharacterized protein [Drosophila virilis]|uniref:Uncharacterized protein n=1 Tax=Drosophila virilis TaxID=7244 RepID=B4LSQ0_DROVI|nr:uncharacterized protein Dvir_GJ16624 [Drosophila virilis]
MFVDDEGELFNPFSIGPAGSGERYEYKMPSSPTYPPPVFATWPPPKVPTNRSVSQCTFVKQAAAAMHNEQSQRGEVAISKAINEEMAASKQLAADERRIDAGGQSKTSLSNTDPKGKSVTTLMPVRERRASSPSSSMSRLSIALRATSKKSLNSQQSTAKSHVSQTPAKTASKMSANSYDSNKTLVPNTELKQLKGSLNITASKGSNAKDSDNVSRSSRRADAGGHAKDAISRVSIKSQAEKLQADKISLRSKASKAHADNVSRVTDQFKGSDYRADTVSRASVLSKTNDQRADNISRVSVKSKTSEHPSKAGDHRADNISRISVKSKASGHQADTVSHHSTAAHAGDYVSQSDGNKVEDKSQPKTATEPSLTEVAETVKKELEQSMATSKTLAKKAAELSERLKAGNQFKHNRFHSLIRMYTNTEPLKRCREDRMSFWFKDAVLS